MIRQSRYSLLVNQGSTATLNITIPGTFATIFSNQSTFMGRVISKVTMQFAAPTAGDYVNVTITDTNSVLPAPVQAKIANYPTVFSWGDPSVDEGNQGIYLSHTGPTVIVPLNNNGIVPSQLVLNLTAGKVGTQGTDTLYITLEWDDYTTILS